MDIADSVVVAAANGTNGKTVTTSARAAGEGDISTRVDSNTVVLDCTLVSRIETQDTKLTYLVVNNSVGDGNTSRASDIEGIYIMLENSS